MSPLNHQRLCRTTSHRGCQVNTGSDSLPPCCALPVACCGSTFLLHPPFLHSSSLSSSTCILLPVVLFPLLVCPPSTTHLPPSLLRPLLSLIVHIPLLLLILVSVLFSSPLPPLPVLLFIHYLCLALSPLHRSPPHPPLLPRPSYSTSSPSSIASPIFLFFTLYVFLLLLLFQ
ncbi:hypothetical protein Pmani_031850 [Petrolisthes manimaculis]|uniref:Uncharacterized protein n=1 Tax=Petrolisthes manimaculis TaxID=1843537 RepID=A0AAE1TRZ9_9EUCA|nr:hypothetical protein Pmani_031850 [Petrolisthes manimaculis]